MKRRKRRYITINRNRCLKEKNNKIDCLFIFIVIGIVLLGLFFIKMGFVFKENKAQIYSYTAEKSDDYEVLLKPNDF